jgi:hypothetical protein
MSPVFRQKTRLTAHGLGANNQTPDGQQGLARRGNSNEAAATFPS